jgi:hypothetical protein
MFFLTVCSAIKSSSDKSINEKSEIGSAQNEAPVSKNDESKLFDCSEAGGYQIAKDRDDEFNLVKIVQDKKVVELIKLPTGQSQNGFALNSAKKTERGFEITIEYGSRIYYQKRFNFECQDHQFFLTKIDINTFDKQNPEKSWKETGTAIKPPVAISKFEVADYITN